jgi:hypothetical protein
VVLVICNLLYFIQYSKWLHFLIAEAGFVVKIKFKFPPACNPYRSTGGELLWSRLGGIQGLPETESKGFG